MLAVLPKCGGAVCHTQLTDTAKHSKRTGNVRPESQPLCPPRPLTCQSYHLRLTPPTWHDQILKSVARQQVSAIRPPRGHALTQIKTLCEVALGPRFKVLLFPFAAFSGLSPFPPTINSLLHLALYFPSKDGSYDGP